jgi:hypothetical protein
VREIQVPHALLQPLDFGVVRLAAAAPVSHACGVRCIAATPNHSAWCRRASVVDAAVREAAEARRHAVVIAGGVWLRGLVLP